MKKVQQKHVRSKKAARDRRILAKARREDGGKPVSEGIRRAAKRAGIRRRPGPYDRIAFTRTTVEVLLRTLEGAQHSAIAGAIPPMFFDAGPARAIDAYRRIEFVCRDLRGALEGGAS